MRGTQRAYNREGFSEAREGMAKGLTRQALKGFSHKGFVTSNTGNLWPQKWIDGMNISQNVWFALVLSAWVS
jgi:hypothetical protein